VQNGYTYSDATFDDLFVKSFQESFIEVDTDSSEEREDDELLEEMEEKKQGGGANAGTSKASTAKAGIITKDDFTTE
jgi:hypothetical protein